MVIEKGVDVQASFLTESSLNTALNTVCDSACEFPRNWIPSNPISRLHLPWEARVCPAAEDFQGCVCFIFPSESLG